MDYKCQCASGFTGLRCEKPLYPYAASACFSQPCFNGGKCHEASGSFQCECQPGFQGVYCEADLRSSSARKQTKKCKPFSLRTLSP
jgi:Notch-like protein